MNGLNQPVKLADQFLHLFMSLYSKKYRSAFFILAKTVLKSVKNKILFELACRYANKFMTGRPRVMNAAYGEFILFSFLKPF